MKALILGHARHGKDTFAEMTGLTFKDSSKCALQIFLFDKLNKEVKEYGCQTEAYLDRVNHRKFWFDSICEYNKDDPSRLAKEILKSNDIYVGMRNDREYQSCIEQGLFDKVFWVDASQRKPKEPPTSMNIQYDPELMILIDNNNVLDRLEEQAEAHFPTSFSNSS